MTIKDTVYVTHIQYSYGVTYIVALIKDAFGMEINQRGSTISTPVKCKNMQHLEGIITLYMCKYYPHISYTLFLYFFPEVEHPSLLSIDHTMFRFSII